MASWGLGLGRGCRPRENACCAPPRYQNWRPCQEMCPGWPTPSASWRLWAISGSRRKKSQRYTNGVVEGELCRRIGIAWPHPDTEKPHRACPRHPLCSDTGQDQMWSHYTWVPFAGHPHSPALYPPPATAPTPPYPTHGLMAPVLLARSYLTRRSFRRKSTPSPASWTGRLQ